MTLAQQIASRIQRATKLGSARGVSDFQFRVTEKGAVLLNLRTHLAELLFDPDQDPFPEKDGIAQ
jgi:hypothetical protein